MVLPVNLAEVQKTRNLGLVLVSLFIALVCDGLTLPTAMMNLSHFIRGNRGI